MCTQTHFTLHTTNVDQYFVHLRKSGERRTLAVLTLSYRNYFGPKDSSTARTVVSAAHVEVMISGGEHYAATQTHFTLHTTNFDQYFAHLRKSGERRTLAVLSLSYRNYFGPKDS